MRFATLLSGGKDSCLAHHVAHQWGFEPTACIVVRPEDPESHMFHVPNLDLAAAQAEAMGTPLIEVTAPAGEGIETGILVDAFQAARDEHGAETIVSGAVASEYQRVRIERAAHQVDVKTHTPIWHKDPVAILDLLIEARFDVRFSAVAAWGMGEDWLGARLDQTRRDALVSLQERYRVHPGGEGGEYESLVLDAPLFQARIVVTEAEASFQRDSGRWRVQAFHLEPKAG
ncbi:MAG: diphthine--ammonia ligase [Candidatus Thermoplasmatota archaeon]|nr:diphthine--ammonia ligase [Candidatus Thermoplasmatota archaeon]